MFAFLFVVVFGFPLTTVHAQIGDQGSAFWLHNDSQCVGGTLVYSDADVQDGGGLAPYTNAKIESASWCSQITPFGACCSVHVSTNGGGFGGNIIPYTWFTFDVYVGATIQGGFSNYQTGTLANAPGSGGNSKGPVGRQGKYYAGIAGEGTSPAAVTASLVANPSSVVRGESSLLSWSSENATSCTGTNFSTGNAVSGSVLVRPSSETSYILTCTNGSTSATDKETIAVIIPLPACSEPNICVGNNVVSACTGAVVEQCSTSCVSQVTTTTSGNGSTGGQYQWSSAGEQTLEETCTGGRENFTPRCPAALGSCSVANQTCWQVSGPAQCDSKKAAEFGLVQQYSCGGTTTSGGGQCAPGQTAVSRYNVMGSSCSGGTVIGRTSETLDAVQIGMWPDGWLASQCSELGATAGDCCEYSQRASNNTGGGFPPNSYYQIRVVRGGTFSQAESSYVNTLQCMRGTDYSCSSVAGEVATQCVGTGGNPNPDGGGGGGTTTTTVPAYCATDDGEDDTNSCSVGRMCFGTDLYYQNSNCSRGFIESCVYGCALGACINPDDGNDDGSGSSTRPDAVLTANPALIKKGNTCNLTFSAQNVSSCTLTGNGIDRTVKATGGVISTITFTTPALQVTTPYTLTCAGRTTIKKVIDCKIAPTFQEI